MTCMVVSLGQNAPLVVHNKVSNLEVGVLEDIGGGVKVLDLLEGTHDLLPDHAALLIHQLYGGPLAIMGHTVPHLQTSLLVLIVHCNVMTTVLLTIMSNLFSSSFTPSTMVMVCPILTMPLTSLA